MFKFLIAYNNKEGDSITCEGIIPLLYCKNTEFIEDLIILLEGWEPKLQAKVTSTPKEFNKVCDEKLADINILCNASGYEKEIKTEDRSGESIIDFLSSVSSEDLIYIDLEETIKSGQTSYYIPLLD